MKYYLHRISLLLILSAFSFKAYCQDFVPDSFKIDSLNNVLSIAKEDTNKIKMLTTLAWMLILQGNYEKALQPSKQSLSLSEKLHFKAGMVESYHAISVSYTYLSNYAEALNNQYKRLHIFEELKDTAASAYSLQYIGDLFKIQENNEEALESYFSSLNLLRKLGDLEGLGSTYMLISQVYYQQRNYYEALKMDSAALTYFKRGNKNDEWSIAWINSSIGNIYEQRNIPDTALLAYLFAMELFKKNYREDAAAKMYINLGSVYTALRKYKLADDYLSNALSIGIARNDKEMIKNSYEKLSVLYNAKGEYKNAYEHYRKFILYKDSISNKESISKSAAYQQQYEYDKKDAATKIEQAKKDAASKRARNQQDFIILAMGIVTIAGIIIALIQYRNNKQKQKANLLITQQKEKVESTLSELKSTQAQLIQSEKMASLGELTAGIAHEIQNPLNFVNNFSEVNSELIDELEHEVDKGNLDEVKAIAKDIKENEQKINRHGKRADAIVKGMLQHSQSSTGLKEPTDLNKLADEYLRLSYHGLRAKDKTFNATTKTDFDETIDNINIIPQDIGRVLLNLYNNAFYAALLPPERGFKNPNYKHEPTVWVSTKKVGDKVLISVRDNGPGIPQKILDKIFQPFFTTKPTGQGTGLGLSLAYDIVKAHNGEIKVETKEGEGSTFIISLP